MSLFREFLLRLIAGKYVVAIHLRIVGNLVIDITVNDQFMLLNFNSRKKDGKEVLFCSAVKTHKFETVEPVGVSK